LLDSSADYFARREPTDIVASVSYNDREGNRYERRIAHDLSIYRDLAYLVTAPAPPSVTRTDDTSPASRPTSRSVSLPTGIVHHGNPPR
ncbi:MAG: hypothetical protein ABIT38_08110, partial [Gemmatimonadaceae bacterium]